MSPFWKPVPIWKDRPCYVVGGGSSLKDFDWDQVRGEAVLGCNAAFYLGVAIVPAVIFGDASFYHKHEDGFAQYQKEGGMVFTNAGHRCRAPLPDWLHQIPKQVRGLGTEAVGWNSNTGASAINLALIFGSNPIYLLGYDMQKSLDGTTHFHNAYNNLQTAKHYKRFLKGMVHVVQDLPKVFPGRRIVNLEEGTSALEAFPKESLKAHFEGKKEAA